MKRTFCYSALFILTLGLWLLPAKAQVGEGITIDYPHIAKPKLVESKGTVTVTFRMVIPADNFRQNQMISMVPVLKNNAGEVSLTPITVTGERKALSDKRKRFLGGYDMAMRMTVVQGQMGMMDYTARVPYAQWMGRGDLALFLDQSKVGYRKTEYLGRIPLPIEGVDETEKLTISHAELQANAFDTLDFFSRFCQLLNDENFSGARSLYDSISPADSMLSRMRGLLDNKYFCGWIGGPIILNPNNKIILVQVMADTVAQSATRRLANTETFVADKQQFWTDRNSLKRDENMLAIYFRTGYNVLEPNFMSNGETINRILHAVKVIRQDPNARLVGIRIIGQSSPEGGELLNEALSRRRANNLKLYLMSQTGLPQENFSIDGIGAAWAELRYLVEKDPFITHKREIISAIDEVPFSTANDVLAYMKQRWPADAGYMQRSLFPLLRNATFLKVYFEEKVDPQEYTFSEAIRLLNAGDYAKALPLLESLKKEERTWIPLAVCYAMTGKKSEADYYLARMALKSMTDKASQQ